jgi:PAS domain S-box-containing protein
MSDQARTLDEARRELDALLNSIKDYAIFRTDKDGNVLTWNAGARAIKQYEAHEIVGHHFSRFYTPEDVAAGKPQRLLAAAAGEGRAEDEGWRVRKDGSRFWADVVLSPMKDDSGAPIGYVKVTRDLTERRQAQEALRRSEESLSATLYSIGDGVIATDEEGRVTRLNPVAERLTGWRQDDARGRSIDEVFHIVNEHTRAAAKNPIGRVLSEGIIVGLANHTALLSRDGTERPIADSGAPIRDPSGAIHGAVLVFRDVTDERAAEEALRQSEEKLRLMIGSVKDYAIIMLDPAGNVASWNPGAERITGYASDEIIGSHFSGLYPPEEVQAGTPGRELAETAARDRIEDEGWRVRKGGSRFWANVVMSAIRDDGGRLVGFAKVTRDMTERRRAEEELSRQAAQQAALAQLGIHAIRSQEVQLVLDRALEAVTATLRTDMSEILELGPDGQTLVARAAVGWSGNMVGRETPATRDSQAGWPLLSREPVLVEDAEKDTRFQSAGLHRDDGIVSGMSVLIPFAGQERPYGVFATYARTPRSFARDDVNFLQAVANVVASASARVRAEEQLRRAELAAQAERERTVRAEHAVHERDVFLSVAAHELRTPLTALQLKLQGIDGIVENDLSESARGTKVRARFQAAMRQTDRLSELVERLLDVSRIAGGRFEMHPESVDLDSLVREVVADFKEKALESKTGIAISAAGDARGEWDRLRLEQVVANLLSNALKYGEGKPVEVTIEGRPSDVRLSVADWGIGIEPHDLGRIFQPFERAAPIQHFAGLGLGLYISRRIVEAHGGTLEVASQAGRGTVFAVTLPKALHEHAASFENGGAR